jgi:cytochrome c5
VTGVGASAGSRLTGRRDPRNLKLNMAFKLGQVGMTAVIAAALAGCARTAPPAATQADAARAGVAMAELEQGRSLYVARCSSCHLPPAPQSKTPAQWPDKIAEMRTRAHLDDDEARKVEMYLVTVASR